MVSVSDFKPLIDIWLVQPRALGKLQQPVERFGAAIARQFKDTRAAAGARRQSPSLSPRSAEPRQIT